MQRLIRARTLSLIAALCVAAAVAGCRSAPEGPAQTVSPDTWAVVDGRSITREEVEKAFLRIQETPQALSTEEALRKADSRDGLALKIRLSEGASGEHDPYADMYGGGGPGSESSSTGF